MMKGASEKKKRKKEARDKDTEKQKLQLQSNNNSPVAKRSKKQAAKYYAKARPVAQSPATEISYNSSVPSTTSLYPPSVYTHVQYSSGICLQHTLPAKNGTNKRKAKVAPNYISTTYTKEHSSVGPTLPYPLLWSHRYAAQEAAQCGVTSNVFRLLGTVKRTVVARTPPPKEKNKDDCGLRFPVDRHKRAKLTKTQAKAQAKIELNNMGCHDYTDLDVEQKASQISSEWNNVWSTENMPRTLHPKYGHLLPAMVNDPHYVPLHHIMDKWHFAECNPPSPVQLYDGLREIDIRLSLVLKSLAELQSPEDALYKTPLILSYPRLIPLSLTDHYDVEVAVYAHRLLPEVFTALHLHRVMTALDKESFQLTQTLHLPPRPTQPTFKSSPLPKLIFRATEASIGDNKEGTKQKESTRQSTIDLTIKDSTRTNTETLSVFSITGLLKMWESTGNDTSNWPIIHARLLALPFEVDLMIHQQHAVCWMLQMESLGGFGINSILWEEREWLDGGKYYYSPALGQIRLVKPPTVHGGILSDEMGLGKTVMILGLIVATLDQLKKDTNRLHSTLIIVPPSLVGQWYDEIKMITRGRLTVQFYDRIQGFTPEYDHVPDICITTYNALGSGSKSLRKIKCLLNDMRWGRIVLDEMQEIRSSTSSIAKSCDQLDSPRRWMLSGTPLFDGIDDLRGELNILSLEPYAAKNEDGFFDFYITEHWRQQSMQAIDTLSIIGLFLLRRSKSMTLVSSGEPIMGLKPLTVEFIPVSQKPCERALYCFLEFIVAKELEKPKLESDKGSSSRRFCLRLLRELCISPILLSGGLGVNSQLVKLNNLLVNYNRNDLQQNLERQNEGNRVLSCIEAIRFLSQIQQTVSTSDDFVSGMMLGHGGGMTKRNRASISSVVERVEACRAKLYKSEQMLRKARSTKAKAYWHLALERITMGHSLPGRIKSSISSIWKWRAIVDHQHQQKRKAINLPHFLCRGWRPSEQFLNHGLLAAHPEFAWLCPSALALHEIPCEVTLQEITQTILKIMKRSSGIKVVPIQNHRLQDKWKAIVQFKISDDAKTLAKLAVKGVVVKTSVVPHFIQSELVRAQNVYTESRNLNNVFPTPAGAHRMKKARLEIESAQRGLQIILDDKNHYESKHIKLRRAKDESRSSYPCTAKSLYSTKNNVITLGNQHLTTHYPIVKEQLKLLRNLERASEVSPSVKQMSAYESLEAMSMKEWDKTSCPICLGQLGSADPKISDDSGPGMVALTSCSHLYCAKCIMDFVTSASHNRPLQCPECRKDLTPSEFVFVDPRLSRDVEKIEIEKRSNAKIIIQKAGKILEDSNGCLDADLWYQLFLAIDVPCHVSQRGDPKLSAIPKELIAFFRAATCMNDVNNQANVVPTLGDGYSSKIQALLRDIPENERSVVFTSSITALKHLMTIFDSCRISYRSLYKMQNHSATKEAVETWKRSIIDKENNTRFSVRVLIVQAGAAASGLTLTAACKMFFLEPFICQEEEAQAFARCHRFGQINPVHVKVYFSPVTVESRLLEWRKLTESSGPQDTKVVYMDIMDVDDGNDDNDEKKMGTGNVKQSLFLLGLN